MCSDAHLKYLSEQDLKGKQTEKEKADEDKAQRKEVAAIKERKILWNLVLQINRLQQAQVKIHMGLKWKQPLRILKGEIKNNSEISIKCIWTMQ